MKPKTIDTCIDGLWWIHFSSYNVVKVKKYCKDYDLYISFVLNMRTLLLKHETYLITKNYCGTKIEHSKIILIAGDCYTARSNVFFLLSMINLRHFQTNYYLTRF